MPCREDDARDHRRERDVCSTRNGPSTGELCRAPRPRQSDVDHCRHHHAAHSGCQRREGTPGRRQAWWPRRPPSRRVRKRTPCRCRSRQSAADGRSVVIAGSRSTFAHKTAAAVPASSSSELSRTIRASPGRVVFMKPCALTDRTGTATSRACRHRSKTSVSPRHETRGRGRRCPTRRISHPRMTGDQTPPAHTPIDVVDPGTGACRVCTRCSLPR